MVYTYICYYSTGRDLPQKLAWLHYKFLALHMYSLCANILAICILSVKLLVGLVTELHLHLVVMYFKHQMTYPNLPHQVRTYHVTIPGTFVEVSIRM